LAFFFQQSAEYPVVIAANRDEFLSRASLGPAKVCDRPWVIAGLDLVAGGTWLGLNERGLVAGLLNRRTGESVDPSRRSRGLLCLEMLREPSPERAVEVLGRKDGGAYNPFRLLLASTASAYVGENRGPTIRVRALSPGVHVLTNADEEDPTCPQRTRYRALFAAAVPLLQRGAIEAALGRLQRILADHGTSSRARERESATSLCVHLGEYGTRSSTILFYVARERRWRYFHAEGPPCEAPYAEVALPEATA